MPDCDPTAMVIAAGNLARKPPHMEATGGRVMEANVIGFVTRGRGFYEDRTVGRRQVEAPVAICQYAGIWHCFDPAPGTVWDELYVIYDGRAARECFGTIVPQVPLIHCAENADRLYDAFSRLHAAWFFGTPLERPRLPYYLHEILYELHVACHGTPAPDARDPHARLRAAMLEHIASPEFDLAKFAWANGLSYDTLRKQFQKAVGMSPKQYFLNLKLHRAKELLLLPSCRIGEVSRHVGIADPYYFSRLFRKRTGLSPRAWRRVHRGTVIDEPD